MKRLLLLPLIVLLFDLAAASAQDAAPSPSAAPLGKKKETLAHRIFGGKAKASPAPAETPSAAATPRSRRRHKAAPEASPTVAAAADETPTSAPTPKSSRRHKAVSEAAGSVSPSPVADATPVAAPTPKKRKKSHSRTEAAQTPEASPEVSATPEPTAARTRSHGRHRHGHGAPTPQPSETPVANGGGKPAGEAGTHSPLNEQNPFVPTPGASPKKEVSLADQDANERAQYNDVKAKAMGDKKVQELKSKADGAESPEETRKASRVYYKALYGKMREMDGSLKERIDRMETMTLKRLEGGE